MSIFKRKKEEEHEEESSFKKSQGRGRGKDKSRFKNGDFKDLKPANKRKRKEPQRVWTKKDRILLLLLLVVSVGVSGYLALSARDFKLPGFPRMTGGSFKLFGEDEVVIEKNGSKSDMAQKIINEFNQKTKNLSGVYGLYVVDLGSDYSFGIDDEDVFQAASLIKLPLMAGMFIEQEKGSLSLDTKYSLKNSDKVAGAGSLYSKAEGYEITYRDLVRLMGKQSDNTAFKIVRNILGDTKINEVIRQVGMEKTSLEENKTTPKDIGVFFENLWKAHMQTPERSNGGQGEIISKESADEILDYLTETSYENWLAAGVPEGVRIAHKYGREVHVVNDAGIVYAPQKYIVVIMTKGVVEREADGIFPELSKLIYNQMASGVSAN
jgi:beta-lactamase class A